MREPDATFADPRLAALYDPLNGGEDARHDLDAYAAIVDEVGARHVIDVGCGTGSLAVRLAAHGVKVTAVDPAGASLDVARSKPHAERVTWIHGDATRLDDLDPRADLAIMTGNVAQVFVTDDDWNTTLTAVRHALRPGGWLVFESRRPEARDWEHWTTDPTEVTLSDGRIAVLQCTVTDVDLPLVTFTGTTTVSGETLSSTSTLRFRDRDEIERDLTAHDFILTDLRDAPDRPGKEYVFVARRHEQPRAGRSPSR